MRGEGFMKKVIGIISSVLFLVITLQSCAAGFVNIVDDSGEMSGTAGFALSVCMLIAGIIAIISRTSKGMTITSIAFYALGGIVGIANVGSYGDLKIWSILSFIFAALILSHLLRNKGEYQKDESATVE